MPVFVFYTGEMGLASELSKLFPVRDGLGFILGCDTPVASAFDHGSRPLASTPFFHRSAKNIFTAQHPKFQLLNPSLYPRHFLLNLRSHRII